MNSIDKELLKSIADLHSIPEGSYNIRKNGESLERRSTSDIEIISKEDKSGIDIIVHKGVKNKSVHIPVIITVGDLTDVVYNDFYIGEDADVLIVAGCGIHNPTGEESRHDGIHTFHIEKNAKVRYVEKHLGSGLGGKVLNPLTKIFMKENSEFEMETIQLGGVTYSKRDTEAVLEDNAKLVIKEKILTTDSQEAITNFDVLLSGKNSHVQVISRSVAKGNSKQSFMSNIVGENASFGHVECDGILLDNAQIISVPKIDAKCPEASLVHEAAIGKIAGEQLIKLMSLGLTHEEAENLIIKGYLS